MSVLEMSPETLFGGKWTKIEECFLLGSSSKYGLGSIGGEATHNLTIQEIPSHNHSIAVRSGSSVGSYWSAPTMSANTGEERKADTIIGVTGGSQAHNNMPPYLVVNIWKRTA